MRMALVASTTICELLLAGGADAQTGAPTPTPPVATADTVPQVAEIVVTAQRRSENLQNAAIAVTAVNGEALAKANISTTGSVG